MNFDIVLDGEQTILGRLASYVAKKLLNGKKVAVVNAEKIVVSGKRQKVLREYLKRKWRKNLANPRKGPFYYARPDRLFKRTVRGMLPYKKGKGRQAYKMLRVFLGVPAELENVKKEKVDSLTSSKLSVRSSTITLREIAELTSDWRMS